MRCEPAGHVVVDRRPAPVARDEDHERLRLGRHAVLEAEAEGVQRGLEGADGRRRRAGGLGFALGVGPQRVDRPIERLGPAVLAREAVTRAGDGHEVRARHAGDEAGDDGRRRHLVLHALQDVPVLWQRVRRGQAVLTTPCIVARHPRTSTADAARRRQRRREPKADGAGERRLGRRRERGVDGRGARRIAEQERRRVFRQAQQPLSFVRQQLEIGGDVPAALPARRRAGQRRIRYADDDRVGREVLGDTGDPRLPAAVAADEQDDAGGRLARQVDGRRADQRQPELLHRPRPRGSRGRRRQRLGRAAGDERGQGDRSRDPEERLHGCLPAWACLRSGPGDAPRYRGYGGTPARAWRWRRRGVPDAPHSFCTSSGAARSTGSHG